MILTRAIDSAHDDDAVHGDLPRAGARGRMMPCGIAPRREIDEVFRNARAITSEALSMFDEQRWDAPSPEGAPKDIFPTVGAQWCMAATHQFWHLGQLTIYRKAMNKRSLLFERIVPV